MYGKTHGEITRRALELLNAKLPEWAERALVKACREPDEVPDYLPREGGGLARVPHHKAPTRFILRLLRAARGNLLVRRGRVSKDCVKALGRALHYLQDRCVPSPSAGAIHSIVERSLAQGVQISGQPELPEPNGYEELEKLVKSQGAWGSPRAAFLCALAVTHGALYAVLLNPVKAYPWLVEEAVALRRRRRLLTTYALLACLMVITSIVAAYRVALDALALKYWASFYLFPYAVSLAIGTMTAVAIFSKKLTVFLRLLARVASLSTLKFVTCSGFLSLAAYLVQPDLEFAVAAAALLVMYFALVTSLMAQRGFRRLRREAFWFKWD